MPSVVRDRLALVQRFLGHGRGQYWENASLNVYPRIDVKLVRLLA